MHTSEEVAIACLIITKNYYRRNKFHNKLAISSGFGDNRMWYRKQKCEENSEREGISINFCSV